MNLYILSQYKLIQHLYQDSSYLDLLMNVDDFFDILNIYAYPNWYDAEVVDYKVYKHYINIQLKAPFDKIPHPDGATVLSKYDCMVKYKKTNEYVPCEVKSKDDIIIDKHTKKPRPKMVKKDCFIIDIMIPNKHIINDKVYDIESIQRKMKMDDEESESITSNNDDLTQAE